MKFLIQGSKRYGQKKIFYYFPLTVVIGVCEVYFCSKIYFNHFFTTIKYAQIKNLYKICNIRKLSKINIREIFHLTDPYYFASFGEMVSINFFTKTKKWLSYGQKNLFLAITFELLDKFFLNQEYKISLNFFFFLKLPSPARYVGS